MDIFWVKIMILASIFIGVLAFFWWQAKKDVDDFYNLMYREDRNDESKDSTEEEPYKAWKR